MAKLSATLVRKETTKHYQKGKIGILVHKGGPGSGHHGHAGRPGKRGGSLPGSGGAKAAIVDYLTSMSDLRGSAPQGFKYNSIEQVVLEHGEYFDPPEVGTPLPEGCERGPMKECFLNSFRNMNVEGLTYTEGYAMVENLPLAFEHAWLTTDDGKVVDPTWIDNGAIGYFGIRLDPIFVLDTTMRTGTSGILASDWMDEARIMRDGFPTGALHEE